MTRSELEGDCVSVAPRHLESVENGVSVVCDRGKKNVHRMSANRMSEELIALIPSKMCCRLFVKLAEMSEM